MYSLPISPCLPLPLLYYVPVYAVSISFSGVQRSARSPIDPCTQEVTFLREHLGPPLASWISLQLEVLVVPLWLPCSLQDWEF